MPSTHLVDRGREIWDYCFGRTVSGPAAVSRKKTNSNECMSATSSTAATDEELMPELLPVSSQTSPRSKSRKRKVVTRIDIPLNAPYGQQLLVAVAPSLYNPGDTPPHTPAPKITVTKPKEARSSKPEPLERSVTLPTSLPNTEVRQSHDRLQWGPAVEKRRENLHWDEPRPGKDLNWGPREQAPKPRDRIEWGPVPEKKQRERRSLASLASNAGNSKKHDPFAKWH